MSTIVCMRLQRNTLVPLQKKSVYVVKSKAPLNFHLVIRFSVVGLMVDPIMFHFIVFCV
jgi:hypothetical protein